jgi:AraC-like DNA-binding protein
VAQCEVALAELNPTDIVTRTRAYVDMTLSRQAHNLCIEDAANKLGVSVRTLIRRLGKSDSSFHQLRDAARQEFALRLLNKPGMTVEDIALALSFSDAANFSRAFKRWFGMPPARYRREHLL